MANIKYSDLLGEILPNLSADPSDPVTEAALRRAVIEFCSRSWIWKHAHDPLDIAAGESAVDLESVPGADVCMVLSVDINGALIEQVGIDWLGKNLPGWRTQTGAPRYFTQLDTDQIVLAPVPDISARQSMVVTVALQPSRTSNGFPRWIADRCLHAIADGATANLLMMPGKPWTDLQTGAACKARFIESSANARVSAVNSIGRARLRVTSYH